MSSIKCKVSDCDYWEQMECTAGEIEVTMEDSGSEACSSDSTHCSTFSTKNC